MIRKHNSDYDMADMKNYPEVKPEIMEYVEREIVPRYADFDKAHQEDHARMVIDQSMKLREIEPCTDPDMVYVTAAFHDTGLTAGREIHHQKSRHILESDSFVRSHFSPEQIRLMGEAVEDHRASNGSRPRNIYGLIVAEADRFIDATTIVRRTVQYGLDHYPELDREGHYRRTVEHLNEKYGPQGYLKIWIPGSANAERLKHLHSLLKDEEALTTLFEKIYAEETSGE